MLTDLQKKAAQAIINIFETSSAKGNYGAVTLLSGDPGHLTYGRSQTTLGSGNLFLLIKAYCNAPGAEFSADLLPSLPRLVDKDLTLDHDARFRSLLRQAGNDPVMQEEQDKFFDRVYWTPAVVAATNLGLSSALGVTTVYDSTVHGSWKLMRDRTIEKFGTVAAKGERAWITHYLNVRRDWLANHSLTILHKTVYRMDALKKLVDQGAWELPLPLTVRGVLIDEHVLQGQDASAADESERLLRLTTPHQTGEDVRLLQEALVKKGIDVKVDSDFGNLTEKAVRSFQQQQGLTVDGIVGPATLAALGLD